jgi:hypothetical protein
MSVVSRRLKSEKRLITKQNYRVRFFNHVRSSRFNAEMQ